MKYGIIVAGSLVLLGSAVAFAAAPPAAKARLAAIAQRQADMKQLGASLKTVADYQQEKHNDLGRVRAAAAAIHQVSARMDKLWPAGTGVGVGKSRAKPEIWKERQAFQRRIAGFRAASAGLTRAAGTGDRGQVRTQFRALAGSCKSCHDFYQAPR